jgi:hypothetical protein
MHRNSKKRYGQNKHEPHNILSFHIKNFLNISNYSVANPIPVELQVFLRPERAMRNSPLQRGGLKHVNKFRPERAVD